MSLFRLTGLHKYIPRLEPSIGTYAIVAGSCFIPAIILLLFHVFSLRTGRHEPAGCRKLGLRIESNLADEHDKRYQKGAKQRQNGEDGNSWRVKSLWIYPVKSCKGVELYRGDVVSTGMEYDRHFSFAHLKSPFPVSLDTPQSEKSNHTWGFVTQRQLPKLALVKTEIWVPDPSSPTYSIKHENVQSSGVVIISYPYVDNGRWNSMVGMVATLIGRKPYKSFQIPFNPTAEQIKRQGYFEEKMEIWRDVPNSLCMGTTEAHSPSRSLEELKFFLEAKNPIALFRVSQNEYRKVFRNAPRKEDLGYQPIVGFADAYPLHILNLASVQDVGSKLSKRAPRLSVLQFRANIIITGPEAYAEDAWKRVKIGDTEFVVPCRTGRCLLPNVSQTTGVKDAVEPNKTLRSFRCIDEGIPKTACLGMQLVPAVQEGVIKVGDAVEVMEIGDHLYLAR